MSGDDLVIMLGFLVVPVIAAIVCGNDRGDD